MTVFKRHFRLPIMLIAAGVLLGLSACGRDDASDEQAGAVSEQVDLPADFQPSAVCPTPQSCQPLGEVSVGHGDAVAEFRINPDLDDDVARWGRTLGTVVSCVENGQSLTACVASSDASAECKTEFARLADGPEDWREAAAFDAVFLSEGSPCRPEEPAQ